jgi:hypothetical protein
MGADPYGDAGSIDDVVALTNRCGGLPMALAIAGNHIKQAAQIPWPKPEHLTRFTAYLMSLEKSAAAASGIGARESIGSL